MQDKTSNHATIPTELNIAPRGKSWLHGQLIDGEHGHPTRQSMEKAESAQPNKAPAAVAVVLPEHDAAIREVIALVNQAVRIGQEAARHDFHIRPTDSVNSLKRLDSAMLTIETKMRTLLAGVSAPMALPEWEKVRRGLTMVMLGFAGRPDCSESAAEAALDAVTEPGMPLAGLRHATSLLATATGLPAQADDPAAGFEMWWAEYMPEATQAQAFKAWTASQAQADARENKPLIARQLGEWHEDDGPVAWWAWCGHEWAGEPAWIGTPLSDNWPGYHTHWTPHPEFPADRAAIAAAKGE